MDSIMENRKLVQTSKRKKMISVDGFLYYANRKIDAKTYWECQYRRSPGICKGRAISECAGGTLDVRVTAGHTHEPSALKVASSEFRADLSNRAFTTCESTESVIRSVASHTEPEIQSTLTRGAQIKVIIRRRRKQIPREPTDGDDYKSIDDRYQQTLGGEKFLQTNIATPDGRILIFSTASNMRHLSLAKIWLMDGTFVTAPTNFAQVFSIHSNINEGNVRRFVPLVFMLLPRKNEATYKTAFEGLSERDSGHRAFPLDRVRGNGVQGNGHSGK
ncbi:conserved hypothetical protein [Culex quinquefasciatus]|uniref:FLYWCH-type domain-containing protein n=1 Tax=Culex quinquefasciatus TaxID=7176 RepID=B0WQH8_CULQU|nr:conserved hypothetical protein [Culex quinquefasciatus]|eukprot:XP_001850962.1 conserved hypothetical protein [Culex quinquefasciatus]